MPHAAETLASTRTAIFEIAGARCIVQTADAAVLSALAASFASVDGDGGTAFTLHVAVEGSSAALQPTHFRGAAHLVFTRFGENVFLFDIARKYASAWLTVTVARDSKVWAQRFAPLMLGVFGCAIGVLAMHGACLVRNGRGYLIAGDSMAGKSTLALALAQNGFQLLSDDWTFIRADRQGLLAVGMHAPIKLLPDAVEHFPELSLYQPEPTANGEVAYELEAASLEGVSPASLCTPECVFFLERSSAGPAQCTPASASSVRRYIENSVERLPKELRAAAATRRALIAQVGRLPGWHFRYGGSPNEGALFLSRFVEQLHEVSP